MIKKTYTITLTETDDGKVGFQRDNNGFNPFELIGILEIAKEDASNLLRSDEQKEEIEAKPEEEN